MPDATALCKRAARSGLQSTRRLSTRSIYSSERRCLGWALERFEHVETVGFDYRPAHRVELDVRPNDSLGTSGVPGWGPKCWAQDHLARHELVGRQLARPRSPATRNRAWRIQASPNTFVPGRNLLFLTYATAALAYRRGAKHLVTGVCETDYSGYPDCRDDTIKAMQLALNLGMDRRFVIHTPLMWIDKAQTWSLAHEIGGDALVDILISRFPHLL